jgi:hypothetical protein
VHKVGHNSGIEYTKQKIETCGPIAIVVELDPERIVYTVSPVFNYSKTDVKILSAYCPMFCMEINVRVYRNLKGYNRFS